MRSDPARLACLAVMLLIGTHARAQSVDYTTMEEMFGEPVTTSATGSPQRASQVPADMIILTQDDIRRSGADTLNEVLRFVPGLDVHQSAVLGTDIAIRGYLTTSNPRLLVLVDGRPIYDDFQGGVQWNTVPVQLREIRQIEIVKGPNSALFGFNAASGVINIVTYDPLYDGVNTASLGTGTQGLAEGSAVGTWRADGVGGVRISTGGIRLNEFPADPRGGLMPSHPYTGQVNAEGRWQIRPNVEFTVEGDAVSDTENRYTGVWQTLLERTAGIRSELAAQTALGRLSVSGYMNNETTDLVDYGEYVDTVRDLQFADLFKIDTADTLRLDAEVKDDTATSSNLLWRPSHYVDYAAGLMWSWQLAPSLALTNAVRFDRLALDLQGPRVSVGGVAASLIANATISAVSFNSGAVWAATDLDTLRLLVARGLQLPSLLNLTYHLDLGPFHLIGDPALQPTVVSSAELTYERTLARLGATLHAGIFAEHNDGLISPPYANVPVFTPGGIVVEAAAAGHSKVGGIELSASGSLPYTIHWTAGYTHTQLYDHIKPELRPSEFTRYEDATPRNSVFLGVGAAPGRWELDANARWQNGYATFLDLAPGFHIPYRVGNFLTVSGRIAYRLLKPLTLAVSADQLLQRRIEETPGIGVERRLVFSATLALH